MPFQYGTDVMLSEQFRSTVAAAGLALAGTGHPFGWVVFAAATVNEIAVSALD